MFELLTKRQMSDADRFAVARGTPSLSLMEHAARAVADAAKAMSAAPCPVVVVAGPGNNGGDGFGAARLLASNGYDVRVALVGDAATLKGDAAEMFRRWSGRTEVASPSSLPGAQLIIDAIFGAGLSRAPDGAVAAMIDAINESGANVLSVDVPSGLDGATGAAPGAVVRADRTITFFRKKPGHLLLPGRVLCGEVIVAQIGIPDTALDAIKPNIFENTQALWRAAYPWPKLDGHKYSRGHVVVVSGPAEQTGAARLGARGALRIGAGLVTVVGDRAAIAVNAAHLTGVMVRAIAGPGGLSAFLADERRNAVLIGPGAAPGPSTAADVLATLRSKAAVTLDADALTSFTPEPATGDAASSGFGFLGGRTDDAFSPDALFNAIKDRAAAVVMTPHDGEFKRLFGDLDGDKLSRTRFAAHTSGAVVVLKGADTVIAHSDGRAAINANAPPWLATAGSGDVLAGFVTGLLAQGMPAFEAACAAVWLHGAAASRFGIGLIAEDLPETLPSVLSEHYAARRS